MTSLGQLEDTTCLLCALVWQLLHGLGSLWEHDPRFAHYSTLNLDVADLLL